MQFHNGFKPIMQSNEADDVSFYTCNFGLSVAVPYYLPDLPRGTVHKVRHHIFGRFCTHPLYHYEYSTERNNKLSISEPIPPVLT